MSGGESMEHFHPAVADWFREHFDAPTQPQLEAWQAADNGHHALVAAPTGSGKTLAAFLKAIDRLVQQRQTGTLAEEVSVIYVSPLKALSNDIQRNLEQPLAGIQEKLDSALQPSGSGYLPIRAAVRTGDTTQTERT